MRQIRRKSDGERLGGYAAEYRVRLPSSFIYNPNKDLLNYVGNSVVKTRVVIVFYKIQYIIFVNLEHWLCLCVSKYRC